MARLIDLENYPPNIGLVERTLRETSTLAEARVEAEGATAPETLRQKDRGENTTVWIEGQQPSPKG
jgi:hypothetical protein